MANATVPNSFTIEAKVEDGLDLDGMPKQYHVEKCTTTRKEVQAALEQVGAEYPELHDCMRVATAMLVRLDTIRDEAKLHLSGAYEQASQGEAREVAATIKTVRQILGQWGDSHTLYVH
ncbi:hypothetical protein [Alicycliphilus denitrificans]|uniref:hypothetical protein n=1 Tax=Alicycliphilus denitrificans TaxID=179636 RepID=UPI0005DAA5D6|nr:hypothetical protein [Alicycliphilus denitrificans]GAO23301.1 hypothetical protein ALISP_3121 [Alicycliphilus sp. B1]GAO27331.1 hypothetical protein ALISP_7151 [Alicycliphilus sp. B1]